MPKFTENDFSTKKKTRTIRLTSCKTEFQTRTHVSCLYVSYIINIPMHSQKGK